MNSQSILEDALKKLLLLAAVSATVILSVGSAVAGPRWEAGDYEMTTYQVAFLRKGPAWTPGDTPERQKLQEAHLAHIQSMAVSGKLLVAGPFTDDGDLRGMFVFRTDTLEEA